MPPSRGLGAGTIGSSSQGGTDEGNASGCRRLGRRPVRAGLREPRGAPLRPLPGCGPAMMRGGTDCGQRCQGVSTTASSVAGRSPGTHRLVLLRLGQLGLLHHVVTVFLGPYLTAIAERPPAADLGRATARRARCTRSGIPVAAGSCFPYLVSLSVILRSFVLPVIGAIADRSAHKKQLLAAVRLHRRRRHLGLLFLTGDRYLLGGGAVPGRQHRLRRQRRGLQLLPAAARHARRAGHGVQPRLGHRLPRRRPAARAQPGRVDARARTHSAWTPRRRALEHRLGRRLVGRVHPLPLLLAARTPPPPTALAGGGNVLTDGFRQLGTPCGSLQGLPADAVLPASPS